MELIQSSRTQFFDTLAHDWDYQKDYRQNQQRLYRMIEQLDIHQGDAVLDVGTGTGIAIDPLSSAVSTSGTVLGIDLSARMLEKASSSYRKLILGDCQRLPVKSSSLDVIFAFSVIPHIDQISTFLKESGRVLKPGGLLVILHFMSREIINDFHRKAGTPVQFDTLPSCTELDEYGSHHHFIRTNFREREDLFLWTARTLNTSLPAN